jgi:DNA polymerase-3 subunit delta'
MSWNILGHETAIQFLQIHSQPEKIRHAYLITGAEGVGRETLALAFVKALNCLNPPSEGNFCGECHPCRQIEAQAFPDLAIMRIAEGGRELKIEQIRTMQQSLALAPYQSKYRVVLIPDFQRATMGASNALLKSLEEPPSRAILILTADARESLLETIASRCEVVRLRPMPIGDLAKDLQETHKLSEIESRKLAQLAGGRVGTALNYLRDEELLEKYNNALEQLEEILGMNLRGRLKYVEKLQRSKGQTRESYSFLIATWLTFWRDVLICSEASEVPLVNLEKEELIRRVAAGLSLQKAAGILKHHEEAMTMLDQYVNPRLILENLLLNLPRLES